MLKGGANLVERRRVCLVLASDPVSTVVAKRLFDDEGMAVQSELAEVIRVTEEARPPNDGYSRDRLGYATGPTAAQKDILHLERVETAILGFQIVDTHEMLVS
jgi:hypothetical protein